MRVEKDKYSIYPQKWGNIQIHRNIKKEVCIVAVIPIECNGQYVTDLNSRAAMKIARKIVKALNA